MKRKELLFFIIASLLFTLVLIVGVEIIFRSYFYLNYGFKDGDLLMRPLAFDKIGIFVPDDLLGYKLNPGYGMENVYNVSNKKLRDAYFFNSRAMKFNISTNTLGYRGKEVNIIKSDKIRILIEGGSTAWDTFVDDGDTWSEVLINELEKTGYKSEAINIAAGGYNSLHNRLNYFTNFKGYHPDAIFFTSSFNDMYSFTDGEDYDVYKQLEVIRKSAPKNSKLKDPILRSINYFLFFKSRWMSDDWNLKSAKIATYGPDINDYYCNFTYFSKYYSSNMTWVKNYLDNMMAFINESNSNNMSFYYVLMPVLLAHDGMLSESGFQLPEYNIYSFNRPYIFKSKTWKNWHCRYVAHIHFMNLMINKLNKEKNLNITILDGNVAFYNTDFKDRDKYFADEMHTTKNGSLKLGQELAKQYLTKDGKK